MSISMLIVLANSILLIGFMFGGWIMAGCSVIAASITTMAAMIAFKKNKK